jgi:hypothetical protein
LRVDAAAQSPSALADSGKFLASIYDAAPIVWTVTMCILAAR